VTYSLSGVSRRELSSEKYYINFHQINHHNLRNITKDREVEISSRIKEEYQNGKEYYQYHGKELLDLPIKEIDWPNERFIEWHNEKIYKG